MLITFSGSGVTYFFFESDVQIAFIRGTKSVFAMENISFNLVVFIPLSNISTFASYAPIKKKK